MLFSSNGARFANPNFLEFRAIAIAGGAASGGTYNDIYGSGGGGAGGVLILNNLKALKNLQITVTVGAGGPSPGNFYYGFNGSNSVVLIGSNNYEGIGGGGGGGNGASNFFSAARSGGSGGGGSFNGGGEPTPNSPGGLGVLPQGNNGGASGPTFGPAGGGGGYSSVGETAVGSVGGLGGVGYTSDIGKTYSIGGNGAPIASPTTGAANTGNGGDGIGGNASGTAGLAGGSGAVLIYVPTGLTFNLISGTVNTYALAGYASVKEFITSGQFSLS